MCVRFIVYNCAIRFYEFEPRPILPLSLSYDHRVIDGAKAARITGFLSEKLSDLRTLLL